MEDSLPDIPALKRRRILIVAFFVFVVLLISAAAVLFYLNLDIFKPKYVSVVSFDSVKINRIPQNVILLGRGLPQAEVTLTLTPGQTNAKLKTDKEGNWTFKLPKNLPSGQYILTLFLDDESGSLISIKNYQLEIADTRPFFLKLSFPKVNAQNQQDLDFAEWAKYMRGFGIYPAQENGEIILYSEEEFNKKYCRTGCYFEPKSPQLIISQINIQEILQSLQLTLISQGYHPDALMEYFPNLTPFKIRSIKRPLLEPALNELAATIPEEKLAQFIQEEVTKQNLQDPFWLQVIDTVGFRSVYDLFEGYDTSSPSKSKLTDEDKINAMLSLTIFIGPHKSIAKAGMTAVEVTVMNFPRMIREAALLRNSLQRGEAISLKAIGKRTEEWIYRPTYPQSASQIIKARIDQTFKFLVEAYPEGNFEVFSTKGSSAVIYVDKNNPQYVYKVYIKDEPGLAGDPAERWISSVRYGEEEARKLKVLSERGIAPELVEYTPPRLTDDQIRLLNDPAYGFHYEGYQATGHISIPVTNRSSNVPIIKMGKVDIDVNGLENMSSAELRRQIDNIVSILEELKFYPGDTEAVVNQNGKLLFIDLGGMIPVNRGSPFANESIREAVESYFSRRLPAALRSSVQTSSSLLDDTDIPLERNLLPGFLVKRGQERYGFWQGLRELHRQGKVAVMDRRTALDMVDDYIVRVQSYFRNNGRPEATFNPNVIRKIAEEGRILVVTREIMHSYSGAPDIEGLATLATADAGTGYIMLLAGYNLDRMKRGVFQHEFSHHLAALSFGSGMVPRNFVYSQKQADIYGQIMSEWLELGADLIAEKVFDSGPGPYYGHFPKRYTAMTKLKNRLGLSDLDFMEYAMTGNDYVLMDKISSRMSPDEFLAIVENTINTANLQRMYEIWDRSLDNRKVYAKVNGKFDWVKAREVAFISTISTGTVVEAALLADLITKINRGQPAPSNTEIISVTPPGGEDIELLKRHEIVINQVEGLLSPSSTIKVSVFATEDGKVLDFDGSFDNAYRLTYSIKSTIADENNSYAPLLIRDVEALPKGSCVGNVCELILPNDLKSGTYILTAYLSPTSSQEILATGNQLLTIGASTLSRDTVTNPRITVSAVTIHNRRQTVFSGMSEVVDSVTPTDRMTSIPIGIVYSDGSVDYLAFNFEDNLSVGPLGSEKDNCIWNKDPYGECDQEKHQVYDYEINSCTNEVRKFNYHYVDGQCGYAASDQFPPVPDAPSVPESGSVSSCPSPYSQCGQTAGLEDYPQTDTIWVTPICDLNGNITDYQKDNLGNKGECP